MRQIPGGSLPGVFFCEIALQIYALLCNVYKYFSLSVTCLKIVEIYHIMKTIIMVIARILDGPCDSVVILHQNQKKKGQ